MMIVFSPAMLSAAFQNDISPRPNKTLPRGCGYIYDSQILDSLKAPKEFARVGNEPVTTQSAQTSFKETPIIDKVHLPWKWGVACGMHGFNDHEKAK
jgi:hypothetical protein